VSEPDRKPEAVGRVNPTIDEICGWLTQEATAHELPVAFFTALIWQESHLDPLAFSARGAAGIAQFMPKTASWRGLIDPYEPRQALAESARFLHELHKRFGNLGLAAAAYNAGPKRLRDWLLGVGTLPAETKDYVEVITGVPPEEWAKSSSPSRPPALAASTFGPCRDGVAELKPSGATDTPVAGIASEQKPNAVMAQGAELTQTAELNAKAAAAPSPNVGDLMPAAQADSGQSLLGKAAESNPAGLAGLEPEPRPHARPETIADRPWGLQLIGDSSPTRALAAYRALQKKHATILANRAPSILKTQIGGRRPAYWFRIRLSEATREQAVQLCSLLKASGESCLLVKN
jgi:hypothetical protein